ncbi:MAG: hypothetical protein PHR82_10460, partial [Endomicrobiaceae bacterium]|nr:hypothetical protein [Endomicrobiaceae bacterium]
YLCDNSDISNDFIVFNDDFYLLDIIDFSKIPYYFKNNQISLKYFKNNSFNEMAIRTRQFLFEKGKSLYDFKVHYPIIYNKVKLRYLIPLFKESFKNSGLGLSLRDLYGNWHNVSDKVFMEDNKIGINERYFDYYLKKFNLISGSNDPSDYEKEFLMKKYYKKSKWEI